MADPRFCSTSFHVAALYAMAGDERMDDFFRKLKANYDRASTSSTQAPVAPRRGHRGNPVYKRHAGTSIACASGASVVVVIKAMSNFR